MLRARSMPSCSAFRVASVPCAREPWATLLCASVPCGSMLIASLLSLRKRRSCRSAPGNRVPREPTLCKSEKFGNPIQGEFPLSAQICCFAYCWETRGLRSTFCQFSPALHRSSPLAKTCSRCNLVLGHNLCLHFGADEQPCTTYFDVHQGYRVLTHSHVLSSQCVVQGHLSPPSATARSNGYMQPRTNCPHVTVVTGRSCTPWPPQVQPMQNGLLMVYTDG